jgi:hypothetical protein
MAIISSVFSALHGPRMALDRTAARRILLVPGVRASWLECRGDGEETLEVSERAKTWADDGDEGYAHVTGEAAREA